VSLICTAHGKDMMEFWCKQGYRRWWSKLLQEIWGISQFSPHFNGDWITSVCACTSDCECSSHTSFNHTNKGKVR